MICNCDIIRDLIPLYIDGIASEASSEIVKKHLSSCGECAEIYRKMKNDEIVGYIGNEKTDILSEQKKKFARKSAIAGSIIAGIFAIPVLVCLIVNLAVGSGLDWFFIVLASLLVASSLIIVPLMMPDNKALWTFISFTLTLVLLLGVCCMYTKGDWFFIAASSSLFGLSVLFLPFAVKSKPVSAVIGNKKGLAVMAADTVLYVLMMLSIGCDSGAGFYRISASVSAPFVLFAWLLFAVIRYVGKSGWLKTGLCVSASGVFLFFAEILINSLLGIRSPLPAFSPFVWNDITIDGNVKWSLMLGGLFIGLIFVLISLTGRRKQK